MQLSAASSIGQQTKTARKAGVGARTRRTAGAKGKARLLAALAVIAWTFFLYLHFPGLSDTVQVSRGNGGADDPCRGRYIFMYNLPPHFNADIIRDCDKTGDHWGGLCASLGNAGLGPPLDDRTDGVFTGEGGWYGTNQFALDVIFHNRMKQYECLTNRSVMAAAIFVPFYAGFDFARHHGSAATSKELMVWVTGQPQWAWRMWGRDHFLVAGRTGSDFRRSSNVGPGRGNDLLGMPAARNMSVLVLESTLQHGSDYSVPYPTYFHPRSDAGVLRWQDRVQGQRRTWLMAFVGATRRDTPVSTQVRDHVIAQCKASNACAMLGCARSPGAGSAQCHTHTPATIMRLLQKASFCLQPPGDSWTRRSVFDAMVAGCIPVFFHTASAYKQYRWHLPKDHLSYSVYIPDTDVQQRNVSIEAVLRSIPPAMVVRLREEVIKLIPTVIYADPRSRLETIKDAFDVAVECILDKVERIKKGEFVGSGRPVSEDPPNLYMSTESAFRPKSSVSKE
ncbi:xyloglucan galactosyltransferase KATAMARI1 homolog [Panicum virgatum]|uniref:Exostosin GT47 domain-containing protein n=1 Tax=Panicum virgatum TaxID=38727 RepID=A0A8T0N5F8_PANVG|nr:xyloglucan galactosyltransferase KATAMARI1 homolog [Panicum virgatum]KAG2543552.1 hypothetical protein PVAP13_9NG752500 [Panicum virgatum]